MSRPDGGAPLRLAATGDVSYKGSHATLHSVAINTPGSSALLKVYDGTSTTGTLLASIDCSPSTARTSALNYDLRCANGVYAVLTGANADITLTIF
ncbi:MAG: hypothetical protein ACYC9L_05485 [Sulfuricaulis sp.]